ncbi:hypothetical protein D9619_007164 [Psilocybe cf. subviscida]|uniref:Uncharacterized protein n=1 Tax=Psilocybe cf. subviscida TaxID=2480587 RepID=A0A8H5B2M7_9AGAR|nr:hypothetical protein D9619_007164 [Psilocybe cf. subviscida]
MDNERQSSLPSSLLPHLYKAPNQPRDSGTRTTIDSDDEQSDVHQVSPIQFPYAPPRRIYPQTVQAHPHQQQQRPFLPYDLDQQPVAGATHDVAHQQQFIYTDSLLPPSSSRPIMPVGRATPAYSYPPLQPPASRQQLPSGTSTATRTSWNEGEPGPSSLLHNHQHQHDPRRHRRGESLSPRVPPHIDPFSRRTANYEHDPASFGQHVVRHNAERGPYFSSSLSGPPTIPQHQHQQQLQHPQNQQHPQHQSLSSYFTQQPQPHRQNYPNQQQHTQHQQYQQHQQHQHALSTSQSLSQSRSQQHLLLPDHDNDTAGFAFHTEPQSYGGSSGYPSVNSLSLNTPSPHFPSSSSSGGGGEGSSSSAYTLYHHRSALPNEPMHLEHRLNEHPSHAAHPTDPTHGRPSRLDPIHELPRADRTVLRLQDNLRPHHDPWYSTRASRDLKHGPLFSVVSPRNNARARMEGMSRVIPMDVDERNRDRESEINWDRDKDWEMAWGASVSTGGGVGVDTTPGEGQSQVDGGSGAGGGASTSAAATSTTTRGRRSKAKTTTAKRRRADVGDVDELARQSKGAAVQQGYRHDQKVWQVEEAQAKRPKKTLVACHFCRGE